MRQSVERGMSVRRFGRGERTILYVHGLGEAGAIFADLLAQPMLRDGDFTHTVVDLPGYGRSPWPDEPLRLTALAGELARWLAESGSRPVVVGHSMGGVLAVQLAQAAPSAIAAVVNIEGNVSLDDCTFSGPVAAENLATYVERGHSQAADRILEMGAQGGPERFYYAAFRFADPVSTHRHAKDLVEISAAESMANAMAALPMPATYVAGVPRGLSRRSIDLLQAANVRTVLVEPAGHWVYVDQPETCARVIVDACAESDSPPA